jgi:hypothetical protein
MMDVDLWPAFRDFGPLRRADDFQARLVRNHSKNSAPDSAATMLANVSQS